MRSRPVSERAAPRRGGVMPLTVLSLTLLVGVTAVAIDGGILLEERRHAQATADAAALAAAADLFANYATNHGTDPGGTAATSARTTAAANGYSNDGVQSVVTVNVSPANYQGGPNAGKPLPAGYVEVLVRYNASRTFSGVLGVGTVPVQARAVARGVWGPSSDGVHLLSLHKSGALTLTLGASLDVVGSALRINSDSSTALNLGLLSSVVAQAFNLVKTLTLAVLGLLQGLGGGSPSVNYGGADPDPLRFVTAPDPVALGLTTRATNLNVTGAVDLYPGVYVGGITVSGSANVTLHANADGTPGIYYLQGGGLNVSGSSSLKMAAGETAGVMLYNAWSRSTDAINLSGSGSVTLNPPASGPYKGISIFQARGTLSTSGPSLSLSANGTVNLTGTVYAAYASATLSSANSSNVLGGQLIVDVLTVTGLTAVKIDRGTQPVANTRQLGLVE